MWNANAAAWDPRRGPIVTGHDRRCDEFRGHRAREATQVPPRLDWKTQHPEIPKPKMDHVEQIPIKMVPESHMEVPIAIAPV